MCHLLSLSRLGCGVGGDAWIVSSSACLWRFLSRTSSIVDEILEQPWYAPRAAAAASRRLPLRRRARWRDRARVQPQLMLPRS